MTYTTQFPNSEHDVVAEYGGATRNNKLSWYASLDSSNSDAVFANGYQPFIFAQALTARDTTPSTIYSRDGVINIHYRPSDKDDIQFLAQTGNQKLPWNKGLTGATILGVNECTRRRGDGRRRHQPRRQQHGQPCVVAGKNTGLQFVGGLNQQNANVWYHWSNLGKIQWNHIVNDKLFVQFRLAENFNQYIFGQPFDRAIVNGVTGAPAPWPRSRSSPASPDDQASASKTKTPTAARRCTSRTSI